MTPGAPPPALHSRYNPVQEAERYIRSLSLDPPPKVIILIEPGEGYMIPPLRLRCPLARIIALHAESREEKPGLTPDASWPGPAAPAAPAIPLRAFLEREIPDMEASAVKVVEWRPALARYGERYVSLVSETASFIKLADANFRTQKHFGRRWLLNAFRNLPLMRRAFVPASPAPPPSLPAVVCAAGPGLEEALPHIKASREGLFLIAAASACPALAAWGLAPDIIVTTDGGPWALFHLRECLRLFPGVPLACAITAALPSQYGGAPVIPLSDGSLWQTLLLDAPGVPRLVLPQRGTVAASALDLALGLTGGEIFLAGLDLGSEGLRDHARPYALDRLKDEAARRVSPAYSLSFARSRDIAEGGSFAVYASWFASQAASWPPRVRVLGGSSPALASRRVPPAFLSRVLGDDPPVPEARPLFAVPPAAPRALPTPLPPAIAAAKTLARALKGDTPSARRLRSGLFPLLLSGDSDPARLPALILELAAKAAGGSV